jgi:hypothetical protein
MDSNCRAGLTPDDTEIRKGLLGIASCVNSYLTKENLLPLAAALRQAEQERRIDFKGQEPISGVTVEWIDEANNELMKVRVEWYVSISPFPAT